MTMPSPPQMPEAVIQNTLSFPAFPAPQLAPAELGIIMNGNVLRTGTD